MLWLKEIIYIKKLENNSPTNSSELQIYKESVKQAIKEREDSEKKFG